MEKRGQLPARVAPSEQYGRGAAELRSQELVPMGRPPGEVVPVVSREVPAAGVAPGSLGDLFRASERPGEPVTSGAPVGAGPGPEVLPGFAPVAVDRLRALYARFPDEDLRELIEDADSGGC
jgi:hypothetical protein